MGEGIADIGIGTFSNCTALASVTLPKGLKSIATNAFSIEESKDAIKIAEIVNPSTILLSIGNDGNGYIAYKAQIIRTGANATSTAIIVDDFVFMVFRETYYLISYLGTDAEVTLPTSVNVNPYSVGKNAFRERKDIKSVIIPNGVVSIEEYAFRDCVLLESVSVAGSVKSIANYAFQYCSSLKNVTLSEGIETIGKSVFVSCSLLEEIVLPASLKAIGSSCFRYCSALASVTFGDPDNWYITTTENATSGTNQASRDNAETNATYLKGSGYRYFWYKIAN